MDDHGLSVSPAKVGLTVAPGDQVRIRIEGLPDSKFVVPEVPDGYTSQRLQMIFGYTGVVAAPELSGSLSYAFEGFAGTPPTLIEGGTTSTSCIASSDLAVFRFRLTFDVTGPFEFTDIVITGTLPTAAGMTSFTGRA